MIESLGNLGDFIGGIGLNMPVARAMWNKRIRNGFPTDFQEYIQRNIEREPKHTG